MDLLLIGFTGEGGFGYTFDSNELEEVREIVQLGRHLGAHNSNFNGMTGYFGYIALFHNQI